MKKIQIFDEETQQMIGEHELADIVITTSETFGDLRWQGDAEYHGCKKTDKGRGVVIVTRSDNFTHHVYPKEVFMRYAN